MGQRKDDEQQLRKLQEEQSLSSSIEGAKASLDNMLEIESIQKYILKIEKINKDDKMKLIIEDRINRFNLKFVKEELSSSGTENQVRTIIEEQIDLINDWFGSDQWYLRLPGKDILKCLIQNSVKNLPYEYFKNQLIAEFNEPPKEL